MVKFNFILLLSILFSCNAQNSENNIESIKTDNAQANSDTLAFLTPLYCNSEVTVGAERVQEYLPLLEGKRVGVVGNQSSQVGNTHLVDTLLSLGVDVVRVFSPEHGFRGNADAGEKVNSTKDQKTGLPIVSLYGKNKKPKTSQLSDLDVLVFDIQDVGVRFYTYISTLHLVMEAAAENGTKVLVLDRPNPNGHYVDGPVLKSGFDSFVGMHPVPVVHGMTIGEYAKMINGEGWLANALVCDLTVVTCKGWDHTKFYELPIAPSPNLPTMTAVYLYPSLCFFEGTSVSIGRGTDLPFQVIGHPNYNLDSTETPFSFVPKSKQGAKYPKLENKMCIGYDLHQLDIKELRDQKKLDISYLKLFHDNVKSKEPFFLKNNFINLLAGSAMLKEQILDGSTVDEIEKSWQSDLVAYKEMRKNYLLYVYE